MEKTQNAKNTNGRASPLPPPLSGVLLIEITFHKITNTNKQVNDTVRSPYFPAALVFDLALPPATPGFFAAASPAFFRVAVVFFAAFFAGVFFAAAALALVAELVPVTA